MASDITVSQSEVSPQVEQLTADAVENFGETIDLLAQAAAIEAKHVQWGRIFRTCYVEVTRPPERVNEVRDSIKTLLSAVISVAYQEGAAHQALTAEQIETATGFTLNATFTGFAREGLVSPDLHEDRERFVEDYGEDNVMPSFFVDDAGVLQLGLFIRKPEEDSSLPSNQLPT